ncbi:CPBP family intramembrane glutamic endopeptidase [Spirochaeta africana]|uniref:CAAX amino terminal protease family n=1 Tax=Spirochaeta africana (strain ATCC 700263 / DSM 8902 / Z-7692) TaxID=889378 RepID=H9UL53_SPIAZ|nr:CPBP family intramembrane glutamic endopeptidase [Spirochaeta africana]AFG38246.1 CAAX amino terminal protease family [Spirochaeta africana DSM 8902]
MRRFGNELILATLLFVLVVLLLPPGLGEAPGDAALHLAALIFTAAGLQLIAHPAGPAAAVIPQVDADSIRRTARLGIYGILYAVPITLLIHAGMLIARAIWGSRLMAQLPAYEFPVSNWWIILPIQLMVGMREELVFRGFLQPRLQAVSGSTAGGIMAAAAIFGLAHLPIGIAVVPPAFVGGLLFGLIRQRHGSTFAAGIAHGVYNCSALLLSMW